MYKLYYYTNKTMYRVYSNNSYKTDLCKRVEINLNSFESKKNNIYLTLNQNSNIINNRNIQNAQKIHCKYLEIDG